MSATHETSIPPSLPRPSARRIPWPPVIAAVLCAIVGVLLMTPGQPDQPAHPVSVRTLNAVYEPDGAIALIDMANGAVAGRVPPHGDSFIRGALHGLERIRRVHGVDLRTPYRLTAMSNGRLVLDDLGTGLPVDLEAFGPDNAAAFAKLLGPETPR